MSVVHALRLTLLSQFADAVSDGELDDDPRRERHLALVAVAARTDSTLEDLARVADHVLAWDSWSFLDALGIDGGDIRCERLSHADRRRLEALNGGSFTYSLNDWST